MARLYRTRLPVGGTDGVSVLGVYRLAMNLGEPAARLILAQRLARGKEHPERHAERRGIPGRQRPPGPLIWFHAASIGEAVSLLPVIGRLRALRPGHCVLVTTGTVTSARLLAERLPDGAFHQFVPVDRPAWVGRFLDHWQPALAVWCESEFWPNLVLTTAARSIPMLLIQGRISERSARGWGRFPKAIRHLLAGFALCLGQTEADAERLRRLGARRVACHGNLKLAAPPLPSDPQTLETLRAAIGSRPVWLAASTHPGEEVIAGRVHGLVSRTAGGLLTLIVPRHPERGEAVAQDLEALGLSVARRSAGEAITDLTDVYLADTIGELGVFYRLAPVVFIGKSLAGDGGQNPVEPAHLDCSILFGPGMSNFSEIATRMAAAGAATVVPDPEALAEAVARRLSDDTRRAREAAAAAALAREQSGALDAVVAAILDHLPPVAETGACGKAGGVRA